MTLVEQALYHTGDKDTETKGNNADGDRGEAWSHNISAEGIPGFTAFAIGKQIVSLKGAFFRLRFVKVNGVFVINNVRAGAAVVARKTEALVSQANTVRGARLGFVGLTPKTSG